MYTGFNNGQLTLFGIQFNWFWTMVIAVVIAICFINLLVVVLPMIKFIVQFIIGFVIFIGMIIFKAIRGIVRIFTKNREYHEHQ